MPVIIIIRTSSTRSELSPASISIVMLSFLPTSVDSTWKINWTRVSSLEKVKWQITNLLNRRWLRRYCRYSPGLNWTQVSHLKWGTSCFLLFLWANFTCLFVRKYWKFNFLTVHFSHSTKLACKLFSQRKAKRQLFSYLKNNFMQQHLCSVFITLLSASPSSGLLWFFCLLLWPYHLFRRWQYGVTQIKSYFR